MTNLSDSVLFGVAGFPPAFHKSEFRKNRDNIFQWLNCLQLDWVELQNTYGVKMKSEQAHRYRELADEYNIGISLHAPYYVTLASADEEVVKRSKERILQCYDLAKKIGSSRIIFHPGHYPGKSADDRANAVEKIIEGLNGIKQSLPADDIFLYPETAGKRNQVGSIEEIIYICSKVSFARPCVDVAHVHAFRGGSLVSTESIVEILDMIENQLGREMLEETHFHMYPVEVDHNGEKKHKAFDDRIENYQVSLLEDESLLDKYYPRAENFIEAIQRKKISPVVVCEARDTQDEGALAMKGLFHGD
ncbi:MAG: TIM barrel protein [Coriobacteriia bacterium]|nr:TIM barrel protein [Coriobacteriia bacterium]